MAEENKSNADILFEQAEAHFNNQSNPHKTTYDYIHGLWNVDNTADIDKPVSKSVQSELDKKFNITDIHNSLENDSSKEMNNIPLSAAQGKVLSESISALSNIDETIDELSDRITSLEGWN